MTTFIVPTEAPTVHGPLQGQWTYANWEQLPDDGNRYEIIDGVLCLPNLPIPVAELFAGAPDTTL